MPLEDYIFLIMTYLAVPIAAKDVDLAAEQVKSAHSAGAEMLELRTDYLTELNTDTLKALASCAKATKLPIIVTCRDKVQGGVGNWPLELRTEILVEALNHGADFIDCEYDNFLVGDTQTRLTEALSENKQARLILSAHNFDGTFPNLSSLHEDIQAAYPEAIPKLVYTAGHINDCFEAFDLLHNKTSDAIVLCMGAAGSISRILSKKLDGFVTFASVDEENTTAPGQITIEQLKTLYRWDSIDAETELFGVIGNPVAHSLSPAIFNACFDERRINGLYLPILIEGEKSWFNDFLENAVSRNWLGLGGFSVTIPHKTHALDYVNGAGEFVEPLAEDIGAVNTLKIGIGPRVSGYNTDYAGAMDALCATLKIDKHGLHNMTIAVVGAGGAARAVVAGLADVGAKVTIYNRTLTKARALSEEFKCKYASLDELSRMDAQIVINCTSIGMYPDVDDAPVPAECLKAGMTVFDTVYNPAETLLLKQASQAGATTVSGTEMFIRQAMAQYKLFIGTEAGDPPEKIMRKTVLERFEIR
jgi:3-dehydroquinate dehydratase/shikimate dehydrogenase